MNNRVTKIVILSLLLSCNTAFAEPYLTITCSEPSGNRFDYIDGKIEKDTDKYSGVQLVFIMENANSEMITVIWGHATAYGEPPPAPAKKAQIVSAEANQLTAVRTSELGALVEVYSFFPSNGLLYYAEHSFGFPILDGATSKSMYAKCKFSFAP